MSEHDWTTLSLHGWRTQHPAHWDLVVNRGMWSEGFIVLADGRHGKVNITWQRLKRTPDLDKTLRRLDNRIAKDAGRGRFTLANIDDIPGRGKFMRWVGSDGDVFGAIVRATDAPMIFVLRDVEPSDGRTLKRIALACTGDLDDAPTRWIMHGIDIDLPPYWRLEGLQNLVGMTRGVWMHYPDGGQKASDVLTLRRYAMASHLLDGTSLEEWLVDHLNPKDFMLERRTDRTTGITTVDCEVQAKGWIRRLRGERDPRIYHAWLEPEMDRLMVQEWRGQGTPLPCLRRPI
ncbi:MAG: hypothetical protein EA401_02070 [Planctomycetota bacterium]|nr:MAG: hypothetical protein EA401_02070 [Planctomycetota bacterium]